MQPDPSPDLETVTSVLSIDHDRVDGILAEVVKMVRDGELERAEAWFRDFKDALEAHIRIEEEVLFPAFEQVTGAVGPTRVMRNDHRAFAQFVAAMTRALEQGDARTFLDEHRAFFAHLAEHGMKEERVLYPTTDRNLRPEQRVELLARFRALGLR